MSGLPLIVKGVLRADDARRCVDGGAAGLVVSTHGGRRGSTISSARALPAIVAAIVGQVEIYAELQLGAASIAELTSDLVAR